MGFHSGFKGLISNLEILSYTLYLPTQLQNIRLNSRTDFNMRRLTTFKEFIWDIYYYVANNCTRYKKCQLGYYTAYGKKNCLYLSKQRTACMLRVRKFGHVIAEVIGRRKCLDYLKWLPVV
jgi:hypothetical protein